jgi:hypothetical protein
MATKRNATPELVAETPPTLKLEQRVTALEREVAELKTTLANGSRVKDWRRTIGMFGDDPVMKEIFDEALRIREKDREKARRTYARKPAKS